MPVYEPSLTAVLRYRRTAVALCDSRAAPRRGGHFGFALLTLARSSAGVMSSEGRKTAGAPADRHANIRNDAAVRSMAGSTVLYDCTRSL